MQMVAWQLAGFPKSDRSTVGVQDKRHRSSPGWWLITGLVAKSLQNDFVQETMKLNSKPRGWLGSMPGQSCRLVSKSLQNDFVQKTIKPNSQPRGWLGSMPGQSCRKQETNIQIATWNVRTIIQPGKMNKLEKKYGNLA